MSRAAIAPADNLFDFFHDRVDAAASRSGRLSEAGVLYLSQLLVEHARAGERPAAPGTLTELYARAQEEPPSRAPLAWRELGDQALYVSGFFRQSLSRKLVSLEYYRQMGAAAYRRLARLWRPARSEGVGLDDVYNELSEEFTAASDVLHEVREDAVDPEVASDVDILRLYESWLATGSPRAAARLRELGVLPTRGRGDASS